MNNTTTIKAWWNPLVEAKRRNRNHRNNVKAQFVRRSLIARFGEYEGIIKFYNTKWQYHILRYNTVEQKPVQEEPKLSPLSKKITNVITDYLDGLSDEYTDEIMLSALEEVIRLVKNARQ